MSDFTRALESEIADLERQLQANPAYVKLREARRLLSVYRDHQNTAGTEVESVRASVRPGAPSRGARPTAGAAAAVYDAVTDYLAGRLEPTPINEIMDMLRSRGIKPGGSVPRNSVSSLLSRSDAFVSHGRSGWTLAAATPNPMEKADDAGPEKAASSASVQPSTPVEPGEEVAHDNMTDPFS